MVRPFDFPKNDYEFIFGMHATAFANKDNNLLGTIYPKQGMYMSWSFQVVQKEAY